MKTKIYLFRHGETDWNVAERFQGHIDIPLNDRGRQQINQIVPDLIRVGIEAILSSDLIRALETAHIVARHMNIPVFQDSGLREANLGLAQGLTKDEIADRFGDLLVKQWKSAHLSDADVCYPSGETGNQVYERATQAIQTFIRNNSYQNIGIATHGGVIRRVMQRILPPDAPPVPIPNGIIYCVVYHHNTASFSLESGVA